MPPATPSSSMRVRISPPGQVYDHYVAAQLRLRARSTSNTESLRPRCASGWIAFKFTPLRTPYPHQPQTRVYQTSHPPLSCSTTSSSLYSTPFSTSSSTRPSPTAPSALSATTPIHNRRQHRLRQNWLSVIMTTTTQTRAAGGHHHHHHHHDNVYLTSQNKNDAGVRITRIGLYSNLGMAIAKFIGGYVFHSQAMVADGWHSMTDLASDVLTLATVSFSLRPPTDTYPWGFGKVESLGSLGVSGMLLAGGIFMGINSLETLYGHFFLDPAAAAELLHHGHGHSHSHGAMGPSIHAAWLAAGTVLIKEWLYHASKLLPPPPNAVHIYM